MAAIARHFLLLRQLTLVLKIVNKTITGAAPVLTELLSTHRKPAVITHFDPDGDAIGSALGMALYLEKKAGNPVPVLIPNVTPSFLSWLPGFERVRTFSTDPGKVEQVMHEADSFFLVDFNSVTRVKKMGDLFQPGDRPVILIDHHPHPAIQCDLLISDTSVSATAELIFDLIEAMNDLDLIDTDIAVNLFSGIMTDTGCFSYNSSRPETYLAVAKLLSHPFDKNKVFRQVYDNYSEDRMRLMGYCLYEKMVILPELHAAYIALSAEELKRFRYLPGDTEGFVNLPFSIRGVELTALFIEKEELVKISFRSRGNFAVNTFSERHFSGGGHRNAAGGESHQDLQSTIERFIDTLQKYADEIKIPR